MSDQRRDDELQALLSGYAAGTLSAAERQRLFSAAIHNQDLFDQLMEEETLRATLAHPFAKPTLIHALRSDAPSEAEAAAVAASPTTVARAITTRSPRWHYPSIAALVFIGLASLYFWLKPSTQGPQLAQAPPPPERLAEKETALDGSARPAAPPPSSSAAAPATPKPARPSPPASLRDERVDAPASPAPMAAPASPEATPPAARETITAAETAAPESKRAANAFTPAADPSAQVSALPVPNEAKRALSSGAQARVAAPLRLVDRTLMIQPGRSGQLYVFLEEGNRYTPVAGLASLPITPDAPRALPLPTGLRGTLYVLLAPQVDAELERFRGDGPLPVRFWWKFPVP